MLQLGGRRSGEVDAAGCVEDVRTQTKGTYEKHHHLLCVAFRAVEEREVAVRQCEDTLTVRRLGDNLRSEVSELLRLTRRFIFFNLVTVLHGDTTVSYGLVRQERCGEGPASASRSGLYVCGRTTRRRLLGQFGYSRSIFAPEVISSHRG